MRKVGLASSMGSHGSPGSHAFALDRTLARNAKGTGFPCCQVISDSTSTCGVQQLGSWADCSAAAEHRCRRAEQPQSETRHALYAGAADRTAPARALLLRQWIPVPLPPSAYTISGCTETLRFPLVTVPCDGLALGSLRGGAHHMQESGFQGSTALSNASLWPLATHTSERPS